MSEARKKLSKDEDKHLFSGKQEEQEFLTSRMSIDMIRRKEEETKEEIKRKKEDIEHAKQQRRIYIKEKIITIKDTLVKNFTEERLASKAYGLIASKAEDLAAVMMTNKIEGFTVLEELQTRLGHIAREEYEHSNEIQIMIDKLNRVIQKLS